MLVGASGAGKTSLLWTAMGRPFSKDREWTGKRGYLLYSTVGFNVEVVDGMTVWDVGAVRDRVALWVNYLGPGRASGFVVDASGDEASLKEARGLFSQWRDHCFRLGVPLCVLANKQDAATAWSGRAIRQFFALVDPLFQVQARVLWLAGLRVGCPREIRKKLIWELAGVFDGLVVFETYAPEIRGGARHNRKSVQTNLGYPQESILRALKWMAGQVK